MTWTPVLEADEFLRGVALSGDGQVIYVVGAPRTKPATVLHVSKDRRKSWTAKDIPYTLDGIAPTLILPPAVNPKDPATVYLRVSLDPKGALLRATGFGATIGERFRMDGEVTGIAFDAGRDAVLVATQKGLMRSQSGGSFAAVGNLSRAQCVQPIGDAIYACSWNYVPDEAAVARSDDGGEHFSKVFQYAETVGPTTSCGAETPVGRICPAVWQMYAAQLGIEESADGGGDGGKTGPPGGCHCAIGRRSASASGIAELALVLLLALRRRR
ncbi:MAG: hypothetical protein EXR72_24950 [Myxococcales bacterium]|nr:hypothetical protein [Myxococcales bacterium]